MAWTLKQIRGEVRLIAGIPSHNIQDDRLNEIIQDFWQVTFPSLVKVQAFKAQCRILTRPGRTHYTLDTPFMALTPIATVQGAPLTVSYDEAILDRLLYNWHEERFESGIGNQRLYTRTLMNPAEVSSLCVYSQEHAYFWGDSRLQYQPETQTLAITIDQPLAATDWLRVKYKSASKGRPQWAIIKENKVIVYPIPDTNYIIDIEGIRKPDPLPYNEEITNVPPEFFDFIVYGSALKILSLIDRSGYERLLPIYRRYEAQAMARTHEHLMYTPVSGI